LRTRLILVLAKVLSTFSPAILIGKYTGQPDTFVELKTSLTIRGPHDEAKFEKYVDGNIDFFLANLLLIAFTSENCSSFISNHSCLECL
jgi:hypothetical protein